MDLISKDIILNTDDGENIDDPEEMTDPEEFAEEAFPTEENEEL